MAVLYENYIIGDDNGSDFYGINWSAQTFTSPDGFRISSVKLKLWRAGASALPGTLTVSIQATVGGEPTGSDLCIGTTDGDTLPDSSSGEWREITFTSPYVLAASTKYAIVIRALDGDLDNRARWRLNSAGSYTEGKALLSGNSGSTWTDIASADFMFECWGNPIPSPMWRDTVDTKWIDGDDIWIPRYSQDYVRIITESIGVSDTSSRIFDPVRVITESLGIADARSKGEAKIFLDSLGMLDSISRVFIILRTLAESLGIVDSISGIWNGVRLLSDSLGITDVWSKGDGRIILDSLGIVDSISRVSTILRILSENLGVLDAVSKDDGRTFAEMLGITDSVIDEKTLIRLLSEMLGITDSVIDEKTLIRLLSENLGIVDSASRVLVVLRVLTENLGATDSVESIFIISRIISDSEGITDGLVLDRVMVVADTLGITDDVTRLITYLRTEDDSVGLSDSMARVSLAIRNIDDSLKITDEMSAPFDILLRAVWAFIIMRQNQ